MPTPDEIIAEGQSWLRNEYGMFDPGIKEFGDHMREWLKGHESDPAYELEAYLNEMHSRAVQEIDRRLASPGTVAPVNPQKQTP